MKIHAKAQSVSLYAMIKLGVERPSNRGNCQLQYDKVSTLQWQVQSCLHFEQIIVDKFLRSEQLISVSGGNILVI